LLRRAVEPVFLLDADQRLVYANPSWEHLTGYKLAEVDHLDCGSTSVIEPNGPAALGGSLSPPLEALQGRPVSMKTFVPHRGGDQVPRRVEFWPLSDERGSLSGLLGLIRAETEPPLASEAESHRLRAELLEQRVSLRKRYGGDQLIGQGPAHHRLMEQIRAASETDISVLITGERGTGKRLVARTIHQRSRRASHPLFPFDCSALPPELLDREFFGPERVPECPARLVSPPGSTLLLVNILDLPRDLQGRLASALNGSVRVLATTSDDPEQARGDERLRPDLYYGLTSLVIRLRPLRERLDDLPLLAQHLLERANLRGERSVRGFTNPAIEVLLGYDWPGNLRELARVIDAAHARAQQPLIDVADIPAAIRGHLGAAYNPPPPVPPVMPLDQTLERVERRLIEVALQRARHNKSRAAEILAISRPRLYRRIHELRIPELPEPAGEPQLVERHPPSEDE
jgi:PAS domain S-box-containing protein